MTLTWFLVGSWSFWILTIVAIIFLLISLDTSDNFYSSGVVALSYCSLLALFGDFNAFMWVYNNPLLCTAYVSGYVVLGILWSFARWVIFVKDQASEDKEKYIDLKKIFVEEHNLGIVDYEHESIPNSLQKQWKQKIKSYRPEGFEPPRAKDHKSRIMSWIGFWPASLFWTIADDFIKKSLKALYTLLHNKYQKLSNWMYEDINTMKQCDITEKVKLKDSVNSDKPSVESTPDLVASKNN